MSRFESKAQDYISKNVYGKIVYSSGVKYSTSGQAYTLVMNQVVWYAVRLIIEIDPRAINVMVIKLSEYYIYDNGKQFIDSFVDKLSNSSPPNIKDLKQRELNWLCFLIMPEEICHNPDKYLREGDFVMASRGEYNHAGIYVGSNEIIHFTAPESIDGKFKTVSRIMKTNWSKFLADKTGTSIHVFCNVLKYKNGKSVVEKAIELIGTEEGQYNLFKNNCQHFANYCLNDEKASPELNEYMDGLFVILASLSGPGIPKIERYFKCQFD